MTKYGQEINIIVLQHFPMKEIILINTEVLRKQIKSIKSGFLLELFFVIIIIIIII